MNIKALHYQTGQAVNIEIKNGCIETLSACDNVSSLPYIAPGLVDLQINGFMGYDFNTLPFDDELPAQVVQLLWQEGVTTFFPTIVTNSDEHIEQGMRTIARSCQNNTQVRACIKGIHLEGPFISPEDGPRGAHAAQYVKAPDWELFQRWQDAAQGLIKIITISPEWENSVSFIEKCSKTGVKVAIGHTAAVNTQINAAVKAGATMSTHLGNGAHVMLPRHPNYIWDQLACDELHAGIICDGYHLPPEVVKVFLKVKEKRAIMVSDAAYLSGLAPGRYHTHIGGEVILTTEGRLHLADNPKLLAASVQLQRHGITNLLKWGLMSLADAWKLASENPALFMDFKQKTGLTVGAPADLVLFKLNGSEIDIISVIKCGEIVYSTK